MPKLYFSKRTQKEIDVFGGDAYFDIDGKNVGKLTMQTQIIDVIPGDHTIKMYKSHSFDSFIGIEESTINISEEEELMIKYSPPMMVNQLGNMVNSPYTAEQAEDI